MYFTLYSNITFAIVLYLSQWYKVLNISLIVLFAHSISVTCSCDVSLFIIISIYFNVYSINLNSGSKCIPWICNPDWLYTLNVLSNALFNIGIYLYVLSWIVMNLILLDMLMRNILPWIYMISAQIPMFWCVSFNYCGMSM